MCKHALTPHQPQQLLPCVIMQSADEASALARLLKITPDPNLKRFSEFAFWNLSDEFIHSITLQYCHQYIHLYRRDKLYKL
ncbi:hypothetical protein T265_16060, partial [Opisthorchis viverrini]